MQTTFKTGYWVACYAYYLAQYCLKILYQIEISVIIICKIAKGSLTLTNWTFVSFAVALLQKFKKWIFMFEVLKVNGLWKLYISGFSPLIWHRRLACCLVVKIIRLIYEYKELLSRASVRTACKVIPESMRPLNNIDSTWGDIHNV